MVELAMCLEVYTSHEKWEWSNHLPDIIKIISYFVPQWFSKYEAESKRNKIWSGRVLSYSERLIVAALFCNCCKNLYIFANCCTFSEDNCCKVAKTEFSMHSLQEIWGILTYPVMGPFLMALFHISYLEALYIAIKLMSIFPSWS